MPISGLVLTLTDNADDRRALHAAIAGDARLTIGPATGAKLPVVVDTPDVATDRAIYHALASAPAVSVVEIAFMDFSDVSQLASKEKRRMGRMPRSNR